MNVLIVEKDEELGRLWQSHIQRLGAKTAVVCGQEDALAAISTVNYDVLVLDLNLRGGDALPLADYANYRRPEMKVIFVTSDTFFSNGSIFEYMSNACASVPQTTPPEDMAALVDYHGR